MTQNPMNESLLREGLLKKYNMARANLLLVAIFTVVNILFLLFTYGDLYFLFSASVPFWLVWYGMAYTLRFPADYYGDALADWQATALGNSFFYAMLAVAILIVAVYVALYFLSGKNRLPFLIAALVLIAIDTVAMFFFSFDLSMILDLAFHIWVIVSLVQGIRASLALGKLPPVYTAVPTDIPNYFETKL